jgi:hypothetical protein
MVNKTNDLILTPDVCLQARTVLTPQQRNHIAIPLAYAILITSSLCFALIAYANRIVAPILVTAFWPVQVRVLFKLPTVIVPRLW